MPETALQRAIRVISGARDHIRIATMISQIAIRALENIAAGEIGADKAAQRALEDMRALIEEHGWND